MTQRPIDKAIADEARDDFIHARELEMRRLRLRVWIATVIAACAFWLGSAATLLAGLLFDLPGYCR